MQIQILIPPLPPWVKPRCARARWRRGISRDKVTRRRPTPFAFRLCVCAVLSYDLPYSTGAPLDSCAVLNATASAWPRPTAHGPRRAQGRQQTHVSCTSHRASLDLPVKSYCASSVLSSGACRVAARLLLPLRRLHAFLAGEEASSCRTPHSTARRHVR